MARRRRGRDDEPDSRAQPAARSFSQRALVVLLVVAGGVLLVGRLTPTPTPTTPCPRRQRPRRRPRIRPRRRARVRAFFDAVMRQRDGPTTRHSLEPFVTSGESSAYRRSRASCRPEGERQGVRSRPVLDSRTSGSRRRATLLDVTSTSLEGGYDIDLDSGEPLESPVTLDPRNAHGRALAADGMWQVERFGTGT